MQHYGVVEMNLKQHFCSWKSLESSCSCKMESPNPQSTKKNKTTSNQFFLALWIWSSNPGPFTNKIRHPEFSTLYQKGFKTVKVTEREERNSSCKPKCPEVKEPLPKEFFRGLWRRGEHFCAWQPGLCSGLSAGTGVAEGSQGSPALYAWKIFLGGSYSPS